MGTLHLFNPENDLALAYDTPYFTPPSAALRLSHAFAMLPAWWSDEGDMVIVPEEERGSYETLRSTYNLPARIYDGDTQPGDTAPWGWSKYTRELLSRLGIERQILPSDAQLDEIRRLSHRRITIDIYDRLAGAGLPYPLPPRPVELTEPTALMIMLEAGKRLFIKAPWSGSGRGIIDTDTAPTRQVIRLATGIIKRQGSVTVEAGLDKIKDFAMLFDMKDGKARYAGLSVFFNAGYSAYAGNLAAPEDELLSNVTADVPRAWIEATAVALEDVLESVAARYSGPLGVDMLTYRTDEGKASIAPCIEVNMRMTMGRVARELNSRHGLRGVMQIHRGRADMAPESGIYLTPPGPDFNITLQFL